MVVTVESNPVPAECVGGNEGMPSTKLRSKPAAKSDSRVLRGDSCALFLESSRAGRSGGKRETDLKRQSRLGWGSCVSER